MPERPSVLSKPSHAKAFEYIGKRHQEYRGTTASDVAQHLAREGVNEPKTHILYDLQSAGLITIEHGKVDMTKKGLEIYKKS